ncbi:MAG: hypothetical protein FWC60_06535 [Firmicutes bacterium]|nr:hypothetical protein [Bacillota bacterium]
MHERVFFHEANIGGTSGPIRQSFFAEDVYYLKLLFPSIIFAPAFHNKQSNQNIAKGGKD